MNRLTIALLCSTTILLSDVANACATLRHTVPADRINGLARGFTQTAGLMAGSPPPPCIARTLRKEGMTHVACPFRQSTSCSGLLRKATEMPGWML